MKKLNIAFFAVGSSLKFDKEKILRSDGSSEYYALAKLLVRNPMVNKLILFSKSDWGRITPQERLEFDPHGKIFNPYQEFPEIINRKKPEKTEDKPDYYIKFYETMMDNKIEVDCGVGFISQGWGTLGLAGYLNTLKPPFRRADSLDMTLYYAADVIYYLNMTNIKWWLLATDPRYVKPSMRYRDTYNFPQAILGQHDFDISWRGLKEFDREASLEKDSYVDHKIKSQYSGIEKMNLIGDGILEPRGLDKPHKFTIVSMQLANLNSKKDLRFEILKEYIIDRDTDNSARIFGKWSDEIKGKYSQFKGYIATEDLDKTFADTRYTLVLPTDAGWVTSKYAEMLQLAVVPFLHPRYDTQYHIVPEDHFIRVKDANDFYEKMDYLDKNPEKRIKLIEDLQLGLISNAYTGKFMIDLLNKQLELAGIESRLDDSPAALYTKTIKQIETPKPKENSLEDFFV